MITDKTPRAELEIAAIFECGFDLDVIAKATDKELYEMIQDWIEAGDECGA